MMDKYGYIGIETLLNFCENSKDHAVTPNDFMRMERVRMPEPHWIPCSERLPEETGKYLITEEDGEVCVDTYLVKHNEWYECFPIAWMPLPEPYREGES